MSPRGWLVAGWWIPQLLHRLLDRERTRSLAWRKLYEAREMLSDDPLRRDDHERVLDEPSHVIAGLVLCPLERIRPQVEQHGKAQLHHRLLPYTEAFSLLLQKYRLPLIVAKTSKVAIVGPVEELAAFVWPLAAEKVTLIIPIQVNVKGLACRTVALQQLVLDVGLAGRGLIMVVSLI